MENWIVPCNVKFFDIVNHFQKNDMVAWVRTSAIRKDDIVFLYLGAPYSQIKYKCKVEEEDIPEADVLSKYSYAVRPSDKYDLKKKKYVLLKKIEEFDDGKFDLNSLRANGLGQVQKQARVDRRLLMFLEG